MTAFVTGATSGFGEAIARKLSASGYKLIILGRRKQILENLAKELGNTHIIQADVRDKEAIFKALEDLPSEFKDIEILVNNAGLALGVEKTQDADINDFETVVDTNIKGLLYTTKAALPYLIKNKGYIFNLGSVAGTWPYPGGNVYGGTKAFVKQFSLNLRADLAGTNVRVSNVEPGLCGGTEFSNVRFKGDDARAAQVYENVQYVTPQDIANIVLWLNQQPEHVNINRIEVMPTAQTFNPLKVSKND